MRTGACILAAAAAGLVGAGTARGQQVPAGAWQATADALRKQPGLARFYSFKDAGTGQPDLAGTAAKMTFKADSRAALTTETGRVAGMAAAVLDGEAFEAPALTLPTNAFTVLVWIRPLGMGSKTGNSGSVNGMIATSGSGYNDGWRLAVYDWKTRQPSIELGREQGSFSVRAEDGLSAGFWNHLAATWDGARVRIYLNGMLSAEKPYAGPAVAPKASLRIGFSGYGVGSLKMAVDELAVLDRALPAEEVAALSLTAPLPAPMKPLVARAQAAAVTEPPAAAAAAYQSVANAAGVPMAWKLWAELAATRYSADPACLRTNAEACVALFENPALPAHLRGQAVELLVQASRKGEILPSRVLVKLPEFLELNAEEQRLFGLALSAAYAREKNFDASLEVLKQLLAMIDDSPLEAAGLRQRFAQTLRQAGRFDAAREQYALMMADTRLPAHVQGLAALAIGQVWQQERKWPEAVAAYQAAANKINQVPHITSEAVTAAAECANLLDGKPARDPEANRQRPRPLPQAATSYFVSPKGNDANPGTFEKPFATLERARDSVRGQKGKGELPPGGVTVYLRGGVYAVTNTFVLGEADSGSVGAPVVYRAWQSEKPVLDGGFRVRNFRKVGDPAVLARLPPEARGKVRVADLKAQGYSAFDAQKSYGYGFDNQTVRELYQDGAPLQIARWPNDGTLKISEVLDVTNHLFACKSDRLARWTGASDMMANGYWLYLWAGCTVPVAAIDPAAGAIRLKEKPGYGIAKESPFYVLNLLEEIDRPGEWFLDRATGKLYVWPVKHPWFSDLVLSRWDRPFIEASKVQGLVIQGLTLEYGQQNGLVLDGCVNTTIAGCVFRRLGGTALIAMQSANLKVFGNILHTLGHTGMRVSGGNRKNLTSGQVVVENNDVGNFGRCSRTYNPAVLLEGCGARVAHNRFHHAPSSAMRVEGNDHLVEYNQVDHVVQESDDQGGIDMWGNPSYRGVVIRYNRWQDIGGGASPCGQAGIRFDDAISGMLVYGNLFERCSNGQFGGVQIHGGQRNIIDNNLFVGCRHGVSFSPWGQGRWQEYLASEHIKNLLYADVNIRVPPYSARYPELADLKGAADINSVWRNVFVGSEQTLCRAPSGTDAWDNQVFAEMPDLDALAAQSPFRPLPLAEIGLYDDPARARE